MVWRLLLIVFLCFRAPHSLSSTIDYWGLMAHDDGDLLFKSVGSTPSEHMNYIRARYSGLANSGVDTLKLNVFTSHTYFIHDPKFSRLSRLDSRLETMDKVAYASYLPRIERARMLFSQNYDPVREAISSFKSSGGEKRVVLGIRPSDTHFVQLNNTTIDVHPYVSPFWLKLCPPQLRINQVNSCTRTLGAGNSPDPTQANYQWLLDFTQTEVRSQIREVVNAILQKYPEIDGVEIDFTRSPFLFRKDQGEINRGIITNFLGEIRQSTNNANKMLLVRVPDDMKNALNLGLDVNQWAQNEFVDVITPSPQMVINPTPLLQPFINSARPKGILIYGGMPLRRNRTLWNRNDSLGGASTIWREDVQPLDNSTRQIYWDQRDRITSVQLPAPDYIYGSAMNLIKRGADGIEIYNGLGYFDEQRANWFSRMLPKLSNLESAIDPISYPAKTGYTGHLLNLEDSKGVLPVVLRPGVPIKVSVFVGQPRLTMQVRELRSSLLLDKGETCLVRFSHPIQHVMQMSERKVSRYKNGERFSGTSVPVSDLNTVVSTPTSYFPEVSTLHILPMGDLPAGNWVFEFTCQQENVLMDLEVMFHM